MIQQLVVGGISLPYTSGDKYSCYESSLTKQITMASGRMVQEVRGKVWTITYSYDYMGNDLLRSILALLRGGSTFQVQFLPDTGDSLETGTFLCADLTPPTFAFDRDGVGLWHNLSFTLREVDPHD